MTLAFPAFILTVMSGRLQKNRERASAARGHRDTSGDTFWLAGIYILVHAIFEASKLLIWQHFRGEKQSKVASFCIFNTFVHGFCFVAKL